MTTPGTNTAYTQRSKLRRFILALSLFSLACFSSSASAYTLLFGKWDDPTRGTGATVSWSFIADGAGVDTSNYHDGNLTGLSSIGTLRLSIDSTYGTGAFDAAVQAMARPAMIFSFLIRWPAILPFQLTTIFRSHPVPKATCCQLRAARISMT